MNKKATRGEILRAYRDNPKSELGEFAKKYFPNECRHIDRQRTEKPKPNDGVRCINVECGRFHTVKPTGDGYACSRCGTLWDDSDDGGDHDTRDPSKRMEREENQKSKRKRRK